MFDDKSVLLERFFGDNIARRTDVRIIIILYGYVKNSRKLAVTQSRYATKL
ncbi:MAG: hypothetical protein ACRC1U_10540 [Vibrionaceae bacterium]